METGQPAGTESSHEAKESQLIKMERKSDVRCGSEARLALAEYLKYD